MENILLLGTLIRKDNLVWSLHTKSDDTSTWQSTSSGDTVRCTTLGPSFPWRRIWKMHYPNKVKMFAWRMAHSSLPMRRKIKSRGNDVNTRCPMCNRIIDEDWRHLLFKYKIAKGVCHAHMLEETRTGMADLSSPKEVLLCIWEYSKELQQLIIITLWVLKDRNGRPEGRGD